MRSNSKDKCFTLELEVSHGLLWDIFNHARNFMEKMAKKNSYVAFNKMQSCSANVARTFAVRWENDNKFSTWGRKK